MRKVNIGIVVMATFLLLQTAGYCSDTLSLLKKNLCFITFGGRENRGSINYEHIFATGKKINWSFSAGVQPFEITKKFSIPVSINAFTTGLPHHVGVELAATFYMDKIHPYNGGVQDDFNKQVYLNPFICYRWQSRHWLVFTAGIGPQWLIDPPENDIFKVRSSGPSASIFAAAGISF